MSVSLIKKYTVSEIFTESPNHLEFQNHQVKPLTRHTKHQH